MDFTPFQAASLARMDKIIAGQRDILSALQASAPPPAHTNGHSAQLPLGTSTNGTGAKKLPRGVSLDPKGHPAYVASFTLDDGRRKRIRVTIADFGDDALKLAGIVLDVLKGRERERNLELLPVKLRLKVLMELAK